MLNIFSNDINILDPNNNMFDILYSLKCFTTNDEYSASWLVEFTGTATVPKWSGAGQQLKYKAAAQL